MSKSLFVQINGGTGKNVSFTHVVPELKKEYDYIAVCSPYVDIFECCKDIDSVYNPNEVRDFIFDAKAKNANIVIDRMYDTSDFIYKKINYYDAWLKMCGLESTNAANGSHGTTNLDTTKYGLKQKADDILKQIKDKGFEDFIIFQASGGQSPLIQVPVKEVKDENGNVQKVPAWDQVPYNPANGLSRNYPVEKAQEFISLFAKDHPKTAIILYMLPNEYPQLQGVFRTVVPYLTYYELGKLPECSGVVTIDSSLQHILAGITKTVVIWAQSEPVAFGYEFNKNIIQDCRRDDILYFSQLGPSGAKVSYIKPEDLLKEVNDYLFTNTVAPKN